MSSLALTVLLLLVLVTLLLAAGIGYVAYCHPALAVPITAAGMAVALVVRKRARDKAAKSTGLVIETRARFRVHRRPGRRGLRGAVAADRRRGPAEGLLQGRGVAARTGCNRRRVLTLRPNALTVRRVRRVRRV
ncbi:hypothetical protein ACGFX2_38360 [Streptomyces goshikiensis]|uniref:hypothetical protein n=1 Tax=Streptomyces goshikiensis TaxID=1942 RepID=UPI0037149E81